MGGARRRRLERLEGVAFDAVLVAVAVAVSEDAVQSWLFEHPAALFHGLAALHVVTCPALLVAIAMGYGKAGGPEELQRRGPGRSASRTCSIASSRAGERREACH